MTRKQLEDYLDSKGFTMLDGHQYQKLVWKGLPTNPIPYEVRASVINNTLDIWVNSLDSFGKYGKISSWEYNIEELVLEDGKLYQVSKNCISREWNDAETN